MDEFSREIYNNILDAKQELDKLTTPRPSKEWHEDDGAVLWWLIQEGDTQCREAPYAGTPLDDDWPWGDDGDDEGDTWSDLDDGDRLFWTPLPKVKDVMP